MNFCPHNKGVNYAFDGRSPQQRGEDNSKAPQTYYRLDPLIRKNGILPDRTSFNIKHLSNRAIVTTFLNFSPRVSRRERVGKRMKRNDRRRKRSLVNTKSPSNRVIDKQQRWQFSNAMNRATKGTMGQYVGYSFYQSPHRSHIQSPPTFGIGTAIVSSVEHKCSSQDEVTPASSDGAELAAHNKDKNVFMWKDFIEPSETDHQIIDYSFTPVHQETHFLPLV